MRVLTQDGCIAFVDFLQLIKEQEKGDQITQDRDRMRLNDFCNTMRSTGASARAEAARAAMAPRPAIPTWVQPAPPTSWCHVIKSH